MQHGAAALMAALFCSGCSDRAGSGGPSSGGHANGGSAGSGGSGASGGGAGASGGGSGASGGGGSASGGTGGGAAGGGSGGASDAGTCFDATRLWFEDFETGDYSRWTGQDYGNDWKNGFCHENGFSTAHAVSPTHSHRSAITCVSDESHRGYGGLQFDGDTVLDGYTNQGAGIEAPHGVVNTYHSRLEAPYAFANGRWFSFWTVNNDCGWNDSVITLGLEDTANRLTPAHISNTGGSVEFVANAPAFPMAEWVRTTIYINYHSGVMVAWQNGQKLFEASFSRGDTDICQWHWGAYANQENYDVVLFEDDNVIWKLNEPWTNFDVEPWLGVTHGVCGG